MVERFYSSNPAAEMNNIDLLQGRREGVGVVMSCFTTVMALGAAWMLSRNAWWLKYDREDVCI